MTRPTPERLAEIREIVEHAPWCELACAAVDALAEIDALRADVERLTRERDEARGLVSRVARVLRISCP